MGVTGLLWHSVVKLLGGRVQLVVGRCLQGFGRGWKRLNMDTVEDLVELFKVAFVDGNGLNTDTEEDLVEVFKVCLRGWKRLNTDTEEDLVEVFKVSVVDGNC